jgi:hypothetical protein
MSMRSGELGTFCRALGVGVDLGEREVPEHKPELVAEVLPDPKNNRLSESARRAFVVAILNEGDGCVVSTGHVVSRRNWDFEHPHGRFLD